MKLATQLAAAWMVLAPGIGLRAQEDLDAFLSRIRSPDDAVRLAARDEAPNFGARAVVPLGKVIEEVDERVKTLPADGVDPAILEPRTTARHALTRIVHHAGRPGAEAERAPVLRELEKLAVESRSAYLRREALWLMGFIGGDAKSVETAERLLWDEDRHVAEVARMVLERMPGTDAVHTLANAIRRAGDDEQRADLIFSLAKKGDPSVGGFLAQLTSARHDRVRLSAFEGLARLGAAEGIERFRRALADEKDPLRERLMSEYLRLADELHDRGAREEARGIYAYVLEHAPADFQRERALHRLSPEGEDGAVRMLLAGLDDESERVRRLAIRRLANLEGPRVSEALAKRFEEAKPASRPILLRALAERDRDAAKTYIERAAAGEDAELKITALDLAGNLARPELEGLFLQVAEGGSDAVRPTALKAYFAVAERHLADGRKEEALAGFTKGLSLATRTEEKSRALKGIIAVGKPEAIDRLAPYLADPVLSIEAANGTIAFASQIAATGDPGAAEQHLLKVATGTFPRDVVSRAVEELRKIGRDPQAALRKQGFVLDWWLTGPIQDSGGDGLERSFEPEEKIVLDEVWRIGPRRYRWQELKDLSLDGKVNLLPIFRRSARVIGYAYTELESPEAVDVLFKMGSDDGMACWLNGKRIHFAPAPRSLTIDQDVVAARLEKGKNRILLKIQQGDGDWGFALRITGRDGKPLDLSRR